MNTPSPIKMDESFTLVSSFDDVNSSQHIRDLKLAIEYKHCAKNAPGGVFIVPEMDSLRAFNGVIFVRRGLYRNGIFRFSLRLPELYNSLNTHPEIVFTPPIFNPLVNPKVSRRYLAVDDWRLIACS
jgi:ubiquitin-protein ligase